MYEIDNNLFLDALIESIYHINQLIWLSPLFMTSTNQQSIQSAPILHIYNGKEPK